MTFYLNTRAGSRLGFVKAYYVLRHLPLTYRKVLCDWCCIIITALQI